MFCSKCGHEINDEAVICVHCGCSVENKATAPAANNNDAPNTGFAILGFLIPLVGLILYLVYKDTAPLKAKSAGKGALIGVIVSVAVSVFYSIVMGVIFSSIMSSLYSMMSSLYY